MSHLRIPADRLNEFDLAIELRIKGRTAAEAPRAETHLRIPLGNVMRHGPEWTPGHLEPEVHDLIVDSITELVGKTAHLIPKETPDAEPGH